MFSRNFFFLLQAQQQKKEQKTEQEVIDETVAKCKKFFSKIAKKFRVTAKNSQKWPKRTIVNSECENFRILVPLRFLREINFDRFS